MKHSDVSSIRVFEMAKRNNGPPFIRACWDGFYVQSIFLLKYTEDPGVDQIPIKGGKEMRIVLDLKDVPTTGTYGLWLGLDPTDAPLVLREPPISMPLLWNKK